MRSIHRWPWLASGFGFAMHAWAGLVWPAVHPVRMIAEPVRSSPHDCSVYWL